VVRIEDAEFLFEEGAVYRLRRELHRLIEEERHTRLVVNFAGVRHVSSEVLGILASLQRRAYPVQGSIVLCGLDPLLRDMLRITHLDRVFDVYSDEAEALRLKPVDGAEGFGTRGAPTHPECWVDPDLGDTAQPTTYEPKRSGFGPNEK
jgi:anti-sigma B factor antagonist